MPKNARQDVTLDICRTSWGQGSFCVLLQLNSLSGNLWEPVLSHAEENKCQLVSISVMVCKQWCRLVSRYTKINVD